MTTRLLLSTLLLSALIFGLCTMARPAGAQDAPVDGEESAVADEVAPGIEEPASVDEPPPDTDEPVAPPREEASDAVEDLVEEVDESAEAKRASAGILNPIYALAEKFNFSWFHWIAFALMVAGVVSFALQLVLGKLIVLSRMSISLSEILSDALGLAVSVIGLVLTTQAAAENSTFTTSAFSVLSATGAGALAGLLFYWWGQKQELQAAAGRRAAAATRDILPPPRK
jgi:hypothetical protein